jgi:hypothetical protein
MKWILGFLFWWWQVLGMNKIVATSQSSNNSYELPFGHSLLLNKVSLKNVSHFWTWHLLSLFFSIDSFPGHDQAGDEQHRPYLPRLKRLLWTFVDSLSSPLKVTLSRSFSQGVSLQVFLSRYFDTTMVKIMGIPLILKRPLLRSWGSLWFWKHNAQDHGDPFDFETKMLKIMGNPFGFGSRNELGSLGASG